MDCYVFTQEPTQATYLQLIDFCCSMASQMLLVVRDPQLDPGEEIASKLSSLRPFLVRQALQREWPGTVLLSDDATVYTYSLGGGFEAVLKSQVQSLYAWIHPDAPEDPCFLRDTGDPLLITTSHEQEAYLLLSAQEGEVLRRDFPEVGAIVKKE